MIKYLTLRNKLNYSPIAMGTNLINNFWSLTCWAFGTYLLPVHSVVYIMVFMVVIDFITGIWKALKLKESISSKRMAETIEKMVLYMLGIITSFVLQEHIGFEAVKIMWVFATLIITREYLSIIENIEIITGTSLITAVRKYINKIFPEGDDKQENPNP